MALSRRSKIKELWRHPVGHDFLRNFLRTAGKNERWLDNPLVANAPLQSLDRLAGPGFCDALLEMLAHGPEHPLAEAPQSPAWWKEAVVYHIFLPSFMDSDHDGVGDIDGVAQRLPYLAGLGVDTLWLWPTAPEAEKTGVLALDDLPRPEQAALADLLRRAHGRGMRVVLGLDIDSTPEAHPWFTAAGRENFYVLRPGRADIPPNNWARGAAPVWRWYPAQEAWGLQLAGCGRVDLNWENPSLRRKIAAVLEQWAGIGADGFFFGPVDCLSKSGYEDGNPMAGAAMGAVGFERFTYGPRLHRYLRELRAALPPQLLLAGEVRGAGPGMAALLCAGERAELDMVLDAGHLAACARAAHGKAARAEEGRLELAELKQHYLKWISQYGAGHWTPLFLESSSLPRIVSRLGAGSLYRAVLAKMLAMMLLTLRGTPILYQGQELGLPGTRFATIEEMHDPAAAAQYAALCEKMDAASAFQKVLATAAAHARAPMPWTAGPGGGFTGAVPWMRLPDGADYLHVAAQMEDKNSVWRFYQRLLALRKASPCLVYGSFNPVFAKNKRVFCYFRIWEGEKWYVEMNLTEHPVPRPGRILRSQKLELSNYDLPAKALRAYEANLYRCE